MCVGVSKIMYNCRVKHDYNYNIFNGHCVVFSGFNSFLDEDF